MVEKRLLPSDLPSIEKKQIFKWRIYEKKSEAF